MNVGNLPAFGSNFERTVKFADDGVTRNENTNLFNRTMQAPSMKQP